MNDLLSCSQVSLSILPLVIILLIFSQNYSFDNCLASSLIYV